MTATDVRPATPIERVAGAALREGLTVEQLTAWFVCSCGDGKHGQPWRARVESRTYARILIDALGKDRHHLATREQVTVAGDVEGVDL